MSPSIWRGFFSFFHLGRFDKNVEYALTRLYAGRCNNAIIIKIHRTKSFCMSIGGTPRTSVYNRAIFTRFTSIIYICTFVRSFFKRVKLYVIANTHTQSRWTITVYKYDFTLLPITVVPSSNIRITTCAPGSILNRLNGLMRTQ